MLNPLKEIVVQASIRAAALVLLAATCAFAQPAAPTSSADADLPKPGSRGNADNVPYIGKRDPNGNPVRLAKATGHVSNYSEDKVPPYTLPDNQTQSGVKSRSSKGGGSANYNEIFLEDLKGSELIRVHAEKDLLTDVEHDMVDAENGKWCSHGRLLLLSVRIS